ncbi:MAG: galactose mutarotase [Defluviitaleaceae bacterium]|nr:galactose mutarotase [Defluviitaleaceae bacterium]
MQVTKHEFGRIGSSVIYVYTMRNGNGMEVSFINYGGRITGIRTPDKDGNVENVVLSYDTPEEYAADKYYFGAICGRVAGRIRGGSFVLDNVRYDVTKNDGEHQMHGGLHNFSTAVWQCEVSCTDEEACAVLSYRSVDGEEGFPGTVDARAVYTLNEKNEFTVRFEGVSDKDTLLDMTSHAYFNLCGDAKRDILGHRLRIDSARYAESDEWMLPTGRLEPAGQSPFNTRGNETIGEQFAKKHPQLEAQGGYNHPFVLESSFSEEIRLQDPVSGRQLIIETDCPAVVVYTANANPPQTRHFAICLEAQAIPDAANRPHFPPIVLRKGERYSATIKHTFGLVH